MGFLRLFLALSVINLHTGTKVFGLEGINGFASVQVFFIISGFYMALILNTKYDSAHNLDFYKNRFLKIYPTFFVASLLGLIATWPTFSVIFSELTIRAKLFSFVSNFLIIGQDAAWSVCLSNKSGSCTPAENATVNGPAWSLAVEILFYMFAPFILRSFRKTIIFLIFGFVWQVGLQLIQYPTLGRYPFKSNDAISFNYNLYPSSFTFFALGALVYFLYSSSSERKYYQIMFLAIPFSLIDIYLPWWQIILFSTVVPGLFHITRNFPIDRWLGDLSYPIYILHWPIMYILIHRVNPWPTGPLTLGSEVAILSAMGAILIHYTIQKPIEEKFKIDPRRIKNQESRIKNQESSKIVILFKSLVYVYLFIPLILLYYIS